MKCNKWYYIGETSFLESTINLFPNKINEYKLDINEFEYFKSMEINEEGEYIDTIKLSKLTPGKYRILKPFYSEENQRYIYLSAEFNVE